MIKNVVVFIVGVCLALFVIDYQKLKNKVQLVSATAHRCSHALFDDDKDWNEYALSICQDMKDMENRISELETERGSENLNKDVMLIREELRDLGFNVTW